MNSHEEISKLLYVVVGLCMIKATWHSLPGWYPPPTVFRCTQCDYFIFLDGVSIANVHCHKCGGDEFCPYYVKALVEEREKAHIKNLKAHIENLKAHELFEKSHVARFEKLYWQTCC